MEKSGVQQCFNCQPFENMARQCANETVCGNCAKGEHTHQEFTNTVMKCANCQG